MVLNLKVSTDTESQLRAKAATMGVDVDTFVARLLERMHGPPLDEVLAPLRAEFAASGMTEDELTDLLERDKHEDRAAVRAARAMMTGADAGAVPRAVLDCNVVFQALVGTGAARACWDLAGPGRWSRV